MELNRRNTRMANELEKMEREAELLRQRFEQQSEVVESMKHDVQACQRENFELKRQGQAETYKRAAS